jgi:SulP family sulfate permease
VTYLPRFWLSGMLFFAGIGLLVENVLDSRHKVSRKEWTAIWVIVIINAAASLAWSVLAGVVLSGLIFAIAYGRGGAIKLIMSGATFKSSVIRSSDDDRRLEHLGNKVLIIVLHRYLFFGSVASVTELVEGFLKEQGSRRRADGVCYFVFDWAGVEDVDATAVSAFAEVVAKLLNAAGGAHEATRILFTSLQPGLRKKLAADGVVQSLHAPQYTLMAVASESSMDDDTLQMPVRERRVFDSLDFGMEWVENRLLEHAALVRKQWLALVGVHGERDQAPGLTTCAWVRRNPFAGCMARPR